MNTTGKYVPRNTNQTQPFAPRTVMNHSPDGPNAFSGSRMNGSSSSSSAFSNKDNEYRQARRREAETEAYRVEAERQRSKAESEAAKKKLADSMNYASEDFYPSLGSSYAKRDTPQQPKTVISYKQKMVEAEEQRKLIITAAPEEEEEDDNLMIAIKMRNQQVINKVLNRSPVVHSEYYDEKQYERDDIINIDYTDTDDNGGVHSDENSDEEHPDEINGHVIADRRSGDKGLW